MVSRAGCYCGILFKESRGVTQGDKPSPTILHIVVYVVIRHWAAVVAGEKSGPEGFRRVVYMRDTIFYADEGLLASPYPARLQ